EYLTPYYFELLPEAARVYDINCIADAYWSGPQIIPQELSRREPTSLAAILDRLVQGHEHWDRAGSLVRLRSRTWYLDRPREIPLRFVRRWVDVADRGGALRLDEWVETATSLTEEQLESLPSLVDALGLPRDLTELARVRGVLRLYASLSPAQLQALRQ